MIGPPTPRSTAPFPMYKGTEPLRPVTIRLDGPNVITRPLKEIYADLDADELASKNKKSSSKNEGTKQSKGDWDTDEEGVDGKHTGSARGFIKRLFGLR